MFDREQYKINYWKFTELTNHINLTNGFHNGPLPIQKEQSMTKLKRGEPVFYKGVSTNSFWSVGIFLGKVEDGYLVCTNALENSDGTLDYTQFITLVSNVETFPFNNVHKEQNATD